jgi:hypothetical protein
MKVLTLTLVSGLLFACSTEREIQADFIDASLVKIDIVHRYPNLQQKMLTWRATDNVLYVTYEPMQTQIALGSTRSVMVRK